MRIHKTTRAHTHARTRLRLDGFHNDRIESKRWPLWKKKKRHFYNIQNWKNKKKVK